ncbi:hypothetical protein [Candidatus Lokiarchaeum ossiferum]|uniref:hypothetical protein n=1 Tax=Candidatus Lokiarchaeum ossiferum TaxID=2951803 RepID=UPI00352F94E5
MSFYNLFLKQCYPSILDWIKRNGQQNFRVDSKSKTWTGPYLHTEDGDFVRIITKHCEDIFGFLNVHNEFSISQRKIGDERFNAVRNSINTDLNINKENHGYLVDIAISLSNHVTSLNEYAKITHELFIEVKMVNVTNHSNNADEKRVNLKRDGTKLHNLVKHSVCKEALVIMVDFKGTERKQYDYSEIRKYYKDNCSNVNLLIETL